MKILLLLLAIIGHILPLRAATEHIDSSLLRSRIASSGRLFSIEAKYGDGTEGLDPELSLVGTAGKSRDFASHDWVSNREETFTLSYSNGRIQFELGEVALGFGLENGPGNLYFECIAEESRSALTIIELYLDGVQLGVSCWTFGPGGRSILWIEDVEFAEGFEMTGTINFAWIGSSPDPNSLAFSLGATSGGGALEERSWSELKKLY
jgi:hypothetical protein